MLYRSKFIKMRPRKGTKTTIEDCERIKKHLIYKDETPEGDENRIAPLLFIFISLFIKMRPRKGTKTKKQVNCKLLNYTIYKDETPEGDENSYRQPRTDAPQKIYKDETPEGDENAPAVIANARSAADL